jgi:diacylglycerol kinase (ATP)
MPLKFEKPAIIYNPAAGGGKARKKFEKYNKIFNEEHFFRKMDVYETKNKDEAVSSVLQIHKENKNDLIISIGGDGTISTIINGLMKIDRDKRLPFLPLPSGSGDSLLRDFDITDVESALNNFKKCENYRYLDILFVEELNGKCKWYCINVLGMGFISDIANYAVKLGKKIGAFSYVAALFLALGEFKPYKTAIKYNGGKDRFDSDRVFFLTVSNSKYSGGAIKIAPNADVSDGLMDITILHDINRLSFLNGFRKTFKGNHIHDKGCLSFTTDSIEIESVPDFYLMPDGDIEGNSPVRITVVPKEIKLVV